MARSLIDIGSLDLHSRRSKSPGMQSEGFQSRALKEEPDSTGCNWNAHIERTGDTGTDDLRWHEVVPAMRRCFNLK